jgi:hypothetical protein
MTEHSSKVLLGFEAAGHGDIQYTRLGPAQQLLGTLNPLTQDKLVRRLAGRLTKHPGKMSRAQLHRLRHFEEGQLTFHLRVHQLFYRPQACRTQSASERLEGMAPTRVGIDQCGGNCLFHGIQKQPPTWEPRNSLRIHRHHQPSQSRVDHFAPVAKSNQAAHSVAGGHQGSIGNAEE